MKKYQILELKEKNRHAGSKAREDVAHFAEEYGAKTLRIRCREEKNDSLKERILRYVTPFVYWLAAFLKIKSGSMVIVQNPFYHRQLGREQCLTALKKIKKCKIVSVIHDAECLRGEIWMDKNMENEFAFMKANSDFEIVHNRFMQTEFEKMGFEPKQLVPLEIFDYYTGDIPLKERAFAENSADVVIAGNLNPKKSPYVYKFGELKNKFSVNLYGPNYEQTDENNTNVKYNGSFPSEEIPSVIDGKFGLVWDGDDLTTCAGGTGEYLKYNNPHKTSLYLVSGLPVIIWDKAAMANFIEKESVGLTVSSLEEIKEKINALSEDEYNLILKNTQQISEKLQIGYYLKKALQECENRVENDE